MENIFDLLSAISFLFGAVFTYRFYTGQLKLSDEKEILRKERVEKYGWLLILSIGGMSFGGIGLLISTLIKLFRQN
jgi:hypothetical protein